MAELSVKKHFPILNTNPYIPGLTAVHVLLLCHLDQASNRTTSSVLGCRLGGAPRQQQLDIVHKFHLFNYYFADFSGHFFVDSGVFPPPSLPPLRKFILPKINYSFGGYPPPINPQSII